MRSVSSASEKSRRTGSKNASSSQSSQVSSARHICAWASTACIWHPLATAFDGQGRAEHEVIAPERPEVGLDGSCVDLGQACGKPFRILVPVYQVCTYSF